MSFTHLHLHSQYSLQDGLGSIEQIINKVQEFKMKAVALTDHDGMYGAIEFYKKALLAGIKPILGCEIRMKSKFLPEQITHLILLAQNNKGYRNLCQLISRAHLSNLLGIPAIDRETISEYSEGLIVLSGCLQGEIPLLIARKKYRVRAGKFNQ